MTPHAWRGLAAAGLMLAGLPAWAQAGAGAQNPAPINTFELEAAARHDFGNAAKTGKDERHYKLSYKGALVREEGTPLKSLTAFDPAAEAPDTAGVGSGDRNRYTLRYENGRATAGGAIFEAAGLQPIALRGLESLDLRGSAALASDADGKNVAFAVGLETAPWRLPGLSGTEASNWLVLGVNAQRSRTTVADGASIANANASTINSAVLNARAFVGKAFGWHKSADVGKTASKIERDMLAAAPTLDDAKRLVAKIKKIPVAKRTDLQKQLIDAVGDMGSDTDWTRKAREMALGIADAITDQPTVAAYAEAHGWYQASGPAAQRKARGLFTATLDYWLMPSRDDMLLRLRYESGWDWAQPAARLNRLMVSVALRF